LLVVLAVAETQAAAAVRVAIEHLLEHLAVVLVLNPY
jgi:hypothetical protein